MTKKLSVKQLKELAQFKAISGTGKVAFFKVQGDVAVDVETGKEIKLDSIRRSWEIIINEISETLVTDEVEVESTVDAEKALIEAGISIEEEVDHVAEELNANSEPVEIGEASNNVEEEVIEVYATFNAEGIEKTVETIANKTGLQLYTVQAIVEKYNLKLDEVVTIEVGSIVELVDGTVGKVVEILGSLATVQTADDEIPAQLESLKLTNKEFKVEEAPKADANVEDKPKKPRSSKPAEVVEIPTIELTLSDLTPTSKSFKLVDELIIDSNRLVSITQYGDYITEVKVFAISADATEEEIYKSPKMSLKDALTWMGYSAIQIKAMSNAIRKIRKAYKDQREQAQETAQA